MKLSLGWQYLIFKKKTHTHIYIYKQIIVFGWHVEPDYQSYGYWSVLSRLDIRQTLST
jgi:hypothetical protein